MLLALSLLLPDPVGHDYYALFYLLGFGVAGALLVLAGIHRRYAWRPWLLLMAGVQLLLIIGTKLVAGSVADWQHVLTHGLWNGPNHRSILGGLVGATLGVALLRRWLGFDRRVYDALALPLMVGLAVQGVGCLLTGCCFGTPAPAAGFSVAYAPGTLPFLTHTAHGWLAAGATQSLPVHPAQLYQIILCLVIAAGVLTTRRQPWPAGTRFVLVLAGYALGRLGLEGWRDAAGDVVGSGLWQGLKPVQWELLLALPVLAGWHYYQKRTTDHPTPANAATTWRPLLTVVALLGLTAGLGPQWLARPERQVVQVLLLAVLLLEANYVWQRRRHALPVLRLYTTLGCLAMLTMSQVPAPQDTSNERQRYTTLSLDGQAGTSQQFYEYPYGCSGDGSNTPTYRQRYQVGTLGVYRTRTKGQRLTVMYGVDLNMGSTRFTRDPDPKPSSPASGPSTYAGVPTFTYGSTRPLFAVSPYLEAGNPRYLRIGIGAHLGSPAYDFSYEPGKRNIVRAQLLVEAGYMPYVFAHVSKNRSSFGMGNGTTLVGLGSGFGQNKSRLLAGITLVNTEFKPDLLFGSYRSSFPFVQGYIPVKPRWEVVPYAASDFKNINQFHLQLRYRLPGPKGQ